MSEVSVQVEFRSLTKQLSDQTTDSTLTNIPLDDLNDREVALLTGLSLIRKYQHVRSRQQFSSVRTSINSINSKPQIFELVIEFPKPELQTFQSQLDHQPVLVKFYDEQVLPKIIKALGREPILGDRWFCGDSIKTYSGKCWY